jgi:LysR family nitrogen assimilation transcriptional regulator
MDIKQLNYFVHVADLRSFSKAAAVLAMAQPALSRLIRSLETELGTPLFYRNGRGVVVSEAGERLLPYAKSMVEQADRIMVDLTMLRDNPSGTVSLGVPPTLGQVLVPALVRDIRDRYPNISLRISEGFSGHVYEWLMSGRLDLAIIYDAPRSGNLTTDQLVTEQMFLVEPPNKARNRPDTVAFAEIAELPLILPSRPHGLRILMDTVSANEGIALNVEFEVDVVSAMFELVEMGVGYMVQPYAAINRLVAAGRLSARRIVDPLISRTMVMATTTQRPLSLAARTVLDVIKKDVKSLVESGEWLGTSWEETHERVAT